MNRIAPPIVLLLILLLFAACNKNDTNTGIEENEIEENEIAEIEIIEAEVTHTEVEEPEKVEPEETPGPQNTVTFESGIMGLKFSIEQPDGWNLRTLYNMGVSVPFISSWPPGSDTYIFEISRETTHPSNINRDIGSTFEPYQYDWELRWQQPEEPTDVFINEHGMTIVEYSASARCPWYDDGIYVTTIFIFCENGQDYRENSGTQIFYMAVLDTSESNFEHLYGNARAVVNSFQFHDGANANYQPSGQAGAIGITQQNFPRIDGSTSTISLMGEIVMSMYEPTERWNHLMLPSGSSRTVPSYELLINNYVDLILVPEPSQHVLNFAEEAGVELEFIPIAVEALVFITSDQNPVSEVTREQILQIYSDASITDWAQIGGDPGGITPLNRNPHSGSQTLMDNLILQERELHPSLYGFRIGGMEDMLYSAGEIGHWQAGDNTFALGYTVYFFWYQHQSEWELEHIKILPFDGIDPSVETILSGEYPLSSNYYAVIRADTPPDSPARSIANWLLTPEGQSAVHRAGLGRRH